jgi:hypothetical protein
LFSSRRDDQRPGSPEETAARRVRGDGREPSGFTDRAYQLTVDQVEAARTMVMDGILAAPWLKELPVSQW